MISRSLMYILIFGLAGVICGILTVAVLYRAKGSFEQEAGSSVSAMALGIAVGIMLFLTTDINSGIAIALGALAFLAFCVFTKKIELFSINTAFDNIFGDFIKKLAKM